MHINYKSIKTLLFINKIFKSSFIYVVFLLISTHTISVYSQSSIATTNINNNSNCCTNVTTLQSNQTLLNTFYPPRNNQTINPGSTSIVLNAVPQVDVFGNSYGSTPIQAGDLLMIIQMQGATFNSSNTSSYGAGIANFGIDNLGSTGYISLENTGDYEYVIALNAVPLSGGTLQISGGCNGGLLNTYQNLSSTSSSVTKRFQVVRVPRYQNLTLINNITTTAWNGSVGGIISFVVSGELDLNGFTINATGRGFRGGFQNVRESGNNNNIITTINNILSSGKGEGVSGTPRFVWNGINAVDHGTSWLGYPGGDYGRGAPANAGGGGNTHNAGGGGGGNGGFGGVGGDGVVGYGNGAYPNGGRRGSAIPFNSGKIVMGGGGGGGDANNATTGVKGGAGGGIIMLQIGKIKGLGQLTANGLAGEPGVFANAPDGAGGGGSGGSIQIVTSQSSPLANVVIEVQGGRGGNTLNDLNDPHGPGGGGGGGTVMHNILGANLSITANGGSNGSTNNGNGISHRSSPGQNGLIIQYTTNNLPASVVNTYPNPIANFTASNTCVNNVFQPLNTSNVSTLNNSTLISYLWSFGDGTTSSNINPIHTYTTPGNYNVILEVTTNWGCKNSFARTITVSPSTIPTFTQVPAICSGATLSALPTTSNNGITGTWSPTLNNTATTTYTFTPTAGQCVTTRTMTITVNPTTDTPTGSAMQVFCATPAPTVASLVVTGIGIKWYATANGGTPLLNTTTLINGTTYYASQTVNGCESSSRFAVKVNFNDPQITASATTVCSGTAVTLSARTTSTPIANNCTLPTNLQTGLVGYWPFCGNANDVSGNNNNGTVNGATLTTDRFGNANSAYSFDGVNDFITCDNNNIPNQTFTISTWIYQESSFFNMEFICLGSPSSTTWGTIASNNNIYLNYGRGCIGFGGSIINNKPLQLGEWINLVYVSTGIGGTTQIFKNGTLIGQNINSTSVGSCSTQNLYFGVDIFSIPEYVNGKIDDIAIWNRALSQAEITQLYIPAPTYLWSTGSTTATINPSSTANTTYWCDVTLNGVTCRKEVTITVNPNIIPAFTQVPAICSGATLSALPTTSSNGITGTWSPALNNTATTTYTFTPTAGQCASSQTMTITVNPTTESPTGSATQVFCPTPASTVASLVVTGTGIKWYATATGGAPLVNTTTLINGTTYYASQTLNGCESLTRFAVVAIFNDAKITASATTICSGLSTTLSINYTTPTICNMNITPTTIPLGNPIPGFTYGGFYNGHHYYVYNTPTSWTQGELISRQNGGYLVCINDINENAFVSNLTNNNIWIGLFRDPITCNFRWLDCMDITFTNWRPGEPNNDPCGEPYTQIIRGCSFGLNTWNNLNDNSSNGSCYSNMVPIMEIDPIIYNNPISTTTTYLWSTGETTSSIEVSPTTTTNYWVDIISGSTICRKEISVNVNPNIIPAFTQVPAICSGATLSALPTTSSNGITGTWSPTLNNTATTTYTFTPAAGQCATTRTMTVTVNPNIIPAFTQVPAICSGATLSALPTTSSNGITGTWSPALNNTATTTYTFTPTVGQCATTRTMTVTVNPNIIPAFTQVPAICSGATLSALPTTSSNGITGTWSPALNNTATTTYTFTPTVGQCATTRTMTVMVNPLPITPSINTSQSFCTLDNPTINNLSTNGNVINWYLTAVGGTPLSLNYSLSNGLVLYAASYNPITSCESPTRLMISIQLQNPPLPNIIRQQTFCLEENKTLADINTSGVEMKWYDRIIGGSAIPLTKILQNGDLFYGAAFNTASGCESTSRVTVEIKVNNPNLTFYNYISIDDNDLNKELIIQGLEQFPTNTLQVYNRFGNLVWSSANYDNLNNTFKGMSSANGTISKGSYLPTGTYFFILSYPNNCEKSRMKGFIQIDNKR